LTQGETTPLKDQVKMFDTTLRDGEQSPGATMNVAEKVRIAQQLEKLNVDIIEAGFPISSDGDFEAVKKIAQLITRCEVAGLARANPQDIDRAWKPSRRRASPVSTPSFPHPTSISSTRSRSRRKRY